MSVFSEGDFKVLESGEGYIIYERTLGEMRLVVAANVTSIDMEVPYKGTDVLSGKAFDGTLSAQSCVVISCN